MWRGFYEKDGNKVDLAIKQLTCPIEGGEITGLTTEDKTVKGKIESNRKLAFSLEAATGETLYFYGQVTKTNLKSITGNYSSEEGELADRFQIQLEEVKPNPVAPSGQKYRFTFTPNVASVAGAQDQEHPVQSKLSWSNPLNGVFNQPEILPGFKFISLDGTKSAFEDSKCKKDKWTENNLPKDAKIRKVETILC
jgi:hypothetical protein